MTTGIIRHALCAEFRFLANALLVGTAIAGCVVFGPIIEHQYFPVAQDFKLRTVQRSGDGFVFDFTATRLRACQRITSTWYVETPDGLAVADVKPLARLPGNRPEGVNVSPPNYAAAAGRYTLRVRFECHPFWDSYALMGPFDIGTPPT